MPRSRQQKPKNAKKEGGSKPPSANAGPKFLGIPAPAVMAVFIPPSIHGEFPEGFRRELRNLAPERKLVLLAFPPKSGGTFIRQALVDYLDASLVRLTHSLGGADAGTYLPNLISALFGQSGHNTIVAHSHAIGYYSELQLLGLFDIRPVIMVRSIADMLCSFNDMISREGRDDKGGFNNSLLCGVYTDEELLALDGDARKDFLIYYQAPWYFQFYASWVMAERLERRPLHWIYFDEFRRDPARVITKILQFHEFEVDRAKLDQVMTNVEALKPQLRFNKGIPGRGRDFFETKHHDHLRRLAADYPHIDFVELGVLSPSDRCLDASPGASSKQDEGVAQTMKNPEVTNHPRLLSS